MYRTIIVDDEHIVLNGLANFIDWEACGFQIIGCCHNGNEAWDLCRKTEPELIITDIRMNDGDGLALINNIRSSDLKTEIIILTGFEDFHVAQSAIKNNVLSILLKPLTRDALYDALSKAKNKLESNDAHLHMLKAYTNYNNAMLLHRLLTEIHLTDETVGQLLDQFNITLPSSNYMIALIHVDTTDIAEQKQLQMPLLSILNNLSQSPENFMLVNMFSNKNIPLLIYENPHTGFAGVERILKEVITSFRQATNRSLTIGISLFFRHITAISKAFDQASKALEYTPYAAENCIVDYADISSATVSTFTPFSKSETEHFCLAVKCLDKIGALSIINAFFSRVLEFEHPNIEQVRKSVHELADFTIRECSLNPILLDEAMGRKFSVEAELSQLQYVTDIKEWLTDLTVTLIDHPNVFISQEYSKPIQAALIYIMSHYTDNISASYLSGKLYMSREHFMRRFKKEVGITYHDYLTQHRLGIAKKLLESGEYKVSEICCMVGYPSENYFYKIFKKHVGISPVAYRDRERGQDK